MTAEEHWERFAEFCLYELAAGGPDPHMRYIGFLGRDASWENRAWLAGIYAVGVYNFATAETIWQHWPHDQADADPDGLADWIGSHWEGLKLRRERRAIRTRTKLADALVRYLLWMRDLRLICRSLHRDREQAYEEMWGEAMTLAGVGRYAGFKLLETLARYNELPISMPDLRPRGGWSPRLTLATLEPEFCRDGDARHDRPQLLARSEAAAEKARARLAERYGLEVDRYRFEVFLCDYRQSYEGRRQYPGRSNDSELAYAQSAADYWHAETALWDARAALTPPWARGELRGWAGVRDELGPVLSERRYTWTDYEFDYQTTGNLADPARREHGTETALDLARATLDAWPN